MHQKLKGSVQPRAAVEGLYNKNEILFLKNPLGIW